MSDLFDKKFSYFQKFLLCGKEQESRKKICYHRAKKFTFLRGFDRKNKVF